MMTRTGEEYLAALKDGREVWYDGERVKDVTTHVAFRNTARSFAHLYDLTHEPNARDVLTVVSPETGNRIHRAYHVPRSREDLVARREAYKLWSEATFGFLGRSPDYIAGAFTGFTTSPRAFVGRTYDGSAKVLSYHRKASEEDLYLAHTLVDPRVDSTKSPHEQSGDDIYVRVVAERDGGIVVSGAKMIGTAAAFANDILVGGTSRLVPEDADYALMFTVPVAAPGVKVISRGSYEAAARSTFDNPLASRFDENDALLVYDDVFVPWERVFVYRDVEVATNQWWQTSAFVNFVHQGATRLWTKLEFLTGLAFLIAKANNTHSLPPVKMQLGRLLAGLNTAKSLVLAMEAACRPVPGSDGAVEPDREISVSHLAIAPELYQKAVTEIKLLAGGGPIMLPATARDLRSPELAPVLEKYLRSPGHTAEQRIKLFKLAWDALGTDFGGRHEQYERFYHGAPHNYLMTIVRESDTDSYERLAGACLNGYDAEEHERA
jgi:4-hydroxyphenylacetate 3-monooxygenase